MIIRVKFGALKQGHWYEYLVRFVLGGVATVVAGVVADIWGPAAGGLFLAFPAIFCASATLIEKHERERKEKKEMKGEERGKNAAALDAAGAGLGSVGLAVFGALMWGTAKEGVVVFLAVSTIVWLPLPSFCGERGGRSGRPRLKRNEALSGQGEGGPDHPTLNDAALRLISRN